MIKYSISQRVINEWNKMSNDCVNASSVNMLKKNYKPTASSSTCHLELVVLDGKLTYYIIFQNTIQPINDGV